MEFVEPRYKYRRWDGNDDKWAVAFDFAPGGAAEGQGSDDEAFVCCAGGGTYATPLISIRTPLIPPREQASRILTSGKWLDKMFGMLRAKRHDSDQAWALRGPQRVAVMLRLR